MHSSSNKLILRSQSYCNLLAVLFVLSLYCIAVETINRDILLKFSLDAIVSFLGIGCLLFKRTRYKYLLVLIFCLPLFFNPMLWLLNIHWVTYESVRYNPFIFKFSYLLYFVSILTVATSITKEQFFDIYSKISYYCALGTIILFAGYVFVRFPIGVDIGYGFPRAQFFSTEPSTFAPIILAGACSNLFIQKKIWRSWVCFIAFCLAQSTSGIFALFLALAILGILLLKDSIVRLATNRLRHSDIVTLGVLFLLLLSIQATMFLLPIYAPDIYNVAYARLFRDLNLFISGDWAAGSDRLKQLSDWMATIGNNFWFGWGAYSDIYLFPSKYSSTVGTFLKFILWGGIFPFLLLCGCVLNVFITSSRYEIAFITIISTSILIAAPGVQYDALLLFVLAVFVFHTVKQRQVKKRAIRNHFSVQSLSTTA